MKTLASFVLLLSSAFAFSQAKPCSKNIYSLIGQDYKTFGSTIQLEDYAITNSGSGFLLPQDNKASDHEFGIAIGHSPMSVFYLFLKFQTIGGIKKELILDILQIDKTELKGNSITEYCETKKGPDIEILALIKDTKDNPEYYTKIVKAWRANRKTEQFELVERKKIKRCGNEGYGI